ncbi:MAG: TlpA family protein disulfide reductase [Bacteroidetes bacterium]|nr:MAG: TlpA family protein disulfide reductase [Bacteroidota bacterium]
MKNIFFLGISLFLLLSCGNEKRAASSPLKEGVWRGVLTIDDSTGLIIPFNFDLAFKNDSASIVIHNAEENIPVGEIAFSHDSIFIKMPVFDSEFRCKISGDSLMTGNWINHSRTDNNRIPFTAFYGETFRFDCPEFEDNFPFEGRWECTFGPEESDSSMAVGIFKQSNHKATGTFLTETGDYRYLEGCYFGKYMLLSCFDGSHAFVFHAEVMEDSTILGTFYSGLHFEQTWAAKKNASFKLRDPDSLTILKKGNTFGEYKQIRIDFAFPNLENKKVSMSDEKYKDKVVIVQILGSWCPNCMDETMFLAELDKKYRYQGLEVIGVAFEKTDDFEKAKSNVTRFKKKYNAEYEFLISGFQPKDADKAFPMLSHIMSFPTTIFIDRKGTARKLRTGYSGPATGLEYDKFVKEITGFTELLLKES